MKSARSSCHGSLFGLAPYVLLWPPSCGGSSSSVPNGEWEGPLEDMEKLFSEALFVEKKWAHPDSNRGTSACQADVITTRP